MKKNDLIAEIAKAAGAEKKTVDAVLAAFTETVAKQIKKGEKVSLPGFGTFDAPKRAAREGRNPFTGETIKIKACKYPRFKASKTLKDKLN